ncbi:hypothetical protein HOY80DRAFT_602111 [Tuber brumale]|nr:hypothetical protein HOY80DRAFT_602111 [Tuber brumale]
MWFPANAFLSSLVFGEVAFFLFVPFFSFFFLLFSLLFFRKDFVTGDFSFVASKLSLHATYLPFFYTQIRAFFVLSYNTFFLPPYILLYQISSGFSLGAVILRRRCSRTSLPFSSPYLFSAGEYTAA